jgi:signal transduction histidine kinase
MRDFHSTFVGRFIALFLFFLVPITIVSYFALYFYMIPVIDRDGQAQIAEELVQLRDDFDAGGIDGLRRTIDRRVGQSINDRTVYLFRSAEGTVIAGNVTPTPALYSVGPDAITLGVIPNDRSAATQYIAEAVTLPGGYSLMIGKQTEARGAFQSMVALGIASTLILAFVVGLIWQSYVERYMRRRVAEFSRTASEIVRGDLSKRFATTDGRDEFDELGNAVNGMIDRIEEVVTQLRTVTDAVAHDFRSPLARVRNRLETADSPGATVESLREAHDNAEKEIDRLLGVLNSLLEIARVEAGIGREQMTEVDLGDVARDVGSSYQPLAEEKGVTIAVLADKRAPVVAHKVLLTQAVMNLVDNAVKFSPQGETVAIEVQTGPSYPAVIISDHGPGIPHDDIPKVLVRFVRLNPARPKGGSGLGLSLVAAVARFHGATLELKDNHPGLRVIMRFVTPARSRVRLSG